MVTKSSLLAAVAMSLVAMATSKRVQQEALHAVGAERHVAQTSASCEYLESLFQSRAVRIRDILEQRTNSTASGSASNARLMLRSFQALRAVRRAAACSWVQDGRSEDMAVVQQAAAASFAENPCADVARQELAAAGDTEDAQFLALQRSMQVLLSETCEASAPVREAVHGEDEIWERADEGEAEAEAALDEMVDDSLASPAGSSLLESGGAMRVLRAVGAVMLGLLVILSCALVGAILGALLLFLFQLVLCAGQMFVGFATPATGLCYTSTFSLYFVNPILGATAGAVACGMQVIQNLQLSGGEP